MICCNSAHVLSMRILSILSINIQYFIILSIPFLINFVLQVGHNIYILCHQLAQHNKELAVILKPSEQNNADPKINKALQYYASHTAQIEVLRFSTNYSQENSALTPLFVSDCKARQDP